MIREIFLVKAFTKDKTQGNPAGVTLNANGLDDEQMLKIAADLGFSESAFVLSPTEAADFRLRFFTPTQEVDLCGHATLATFHTLVETGEIQFGSKDHVTKTFQTNKGVLPVTGYRDGLIFMTQSDPQFSTPEQDRTLVAHLLRVSPNAFLDYPIQTVSTGTPKLIIPIKSLDILFSINPDLEGIIQYCQATGARGFYPFTPQTIEKDSDYHARQFNPLAGINEDPVTGVAAGALGAYLTKYKITTKKKITVEQGYAMKKAGKIMVELGNATKVGGYAVIYGKRTISL